MVIVASVLYGYVSRSHVLRVTTQNYLRKGINNASPDAVLSFLYHWVLICVYAENISDFSTKRLIFTGRRTELIQKPAHHLTNRHWGGFSYDLKVQFVFRNVTVCLLLCLGNERESYLGANSSNLPITHPFSVRPQASLATMFFFVKLIYECAE
jgi:hypothetical protein